MQTSKINKYIESQKEEMIKTLSELVSVKSYAMTPSDDKPNGEGAYNALKKCEEILSSLGFKSKNLENYVVVSDFSDNDDDAYLGIMTHLDVVPVSDGWNSDPFTLKVDTENQKLIGRGVIDDKGPAVATMYALKAIKDLGIKLNKNVRLIFGSIEETGMDDLKYYKENYKLPEYMLTPDGSFPVVNYEKGVSHLELKGEYDNIKSDKDIISIKGGMVINAVPDKACAEVKGFTLGYVNEKIEKLDITIKFTAEQKGENVIINAKGVSAHGSLPNKGDNAITGLLSLLSIFDFDDSKGYEYISELSKVLPYNEYYGEAMGLACEDEEAGKLTETFSLINMKDGKFTGGIDIRFPKCCSLKKVYDAVSEKLGKLGITFYDSDAMEPHYVDKNSDFIKTLLSVYGKVTNKEEKCIAEGGVTYLHGIKNAVAFGAEYEDENNNMHGDNECINISTFMDIAKVYANTIIELCK